MSTKAPLDPYYHLDRDELIRLIEGLKMEISRLRARNMDDYIKDLVDSTVDQRRG